MRALSPHSEERSEVKILRISGRCVEVLSPISVMVGTLIHLHFPADNRFFLGEAQSCDAAGCCYQVGIAIEDSYPRIPAQAPDCVISRSC